MSNSKITPDKPDQSAQPLSKQGKMWWLLAGGAVLGGASIVAVTIPLLLRQTNDISKSQALNEISQKPINNASDWEIYLSKWKSYLEKYENFNATDSQAMIDKVKNTVSADLTFTSGSSLNDLTMPPGFVLPSTVTSIGDYVFRKTVLPQGFRLPDKLQQIGELSFASSTLPSNFVIPATTSIINNDAFNDSVLPEDHAWMHQGQVVFSPAPGVGVHAVSPQKLVESIALNDQTTTLVNADEKSFTIGASYTDVQLGIKAPQLLQNVTIDPYIIDDNGTDGVLNVKTALRKAGALAIKVFKISGYQTTITPGDALKNLNDMPITNQVELDAYASAWESYLTNHQSFSSIDAKTIVDVYRNAFLNNLQKIKGNAFLNASLPIGFRLPTVVTEINTAAFRKATFAAAIVIPASVEVMWTFAFTEADLSNGIVLNGGLRRIMSGAFTKAILPSQAFNLPSSVVLLQAQAFQDVTIPIGFALPPTVTVQGTVFLNAILPLGFAIPVGTQGFDSAYTFQNAHLPSNSAWFDQSNNQLSAPALGAVIALITK